MFTPEDGTGLADANSYVTLAFADSYFTDRQNQAWIGLSDPDKQAALIAATDYIDLRFGGSFIGYPAFPGVQALQFPRVLAGPNGVVWGYDYGARNFGCGPAIALLPQNATVVPVTMPTNLLKATCEYALRASAAPLAPDLVFDPSGFKVEKTHEKVGPIEEDITYATSGPGAGMVLLRPYPGADMYLRDLVKSTQGRVIRN